MKTLGIRLENKIRNKKIRRRASISLSTYLTTKCLTEWILTYQRQRTDNIKGGGRTLKYDQQTTVGKRLYRN